jgi:hypothetical protein
MKKILKLVLGLLLVGSMVFGADESAQVIITTSVGETTANSGIKVVESFTPSTPAAFDAKFFSAGSTITLASGVDTSATDASGEFVVMVRRPVNTSVNVTIGGTTMALTGGTATIPTIPYKISGTESPTAVVYVDYTSTSAVTSGSYTAGPAVDGILRDAKAFTYKIPMSALAPLGTYSATITFSITVE